MDVRLTEVEERVSDRRITIDVDLEARDWLGERGYDPSYGARPLNRLIMKQILNPLARLLIDGGVRTGETANIRVAKQPSGETTLEVQRNHAPGEASNDDKEEMAPVGDEEEVLRDEHSHEEQEKHDKKTE